MTNRLPPATEPPPATAADLGTPLAVEALRAKESWRPVIEYIEARAVEAARPVIEAKARADERRRWAEAMHALHQPFRDHSLCAHEGHEWPCWTARLVADLLGDE